MNITVVEQKKDKVILSVEGEDHTLCAALKKELWNDKHVKAAGYHIEHPLIGRPRIIVETDGEDPRKCVENACKRLEKQFETLKASAQKAFK
ncbi:DNA-directed RNA polymerase subunit L [Candidatus Woesearchaeota archaeon]|nr:DNA-directed RNA polymerase subunit L [Candidatus Woesearchaeota archaeon]